MKFIKKIINEVNVIKMKLNWFLIIRKLVTVLKNKLLFEGKTTTTT